MCKTYTLKGKCGVRSGTVVEERCHDNLCKISKEGCEVMESVKTWRHMNTAMTKNVNFQIMVNARFIFTSSGNSKI